MFLWILEEYVYILSRLCVDDQDGQMVLGHELLLLACSRCCRQRGGGQASYCTGTLSLDHLPACSRDTLEHTVRSTKDTIALECLAWAVYNNQLGLGKSPSLSGFESYGQVLQHLVDEALEDYRHCCLACTSVMFKPVERVKSVVTVLWKAPLTERYPMMRDVQEELAGGDQAARGWEQPLDLEVDALKWMKEYQHSYTDVQLYFWLLVRPLTDGSDLVQRLLSVWHWASALDPPICLPVPSLLNIGH